MSEYSVLLVENNDNLREGIKQALKDKGIKTIVEDTKGAKAFSLLKKQKFDIVILDIDLPGVNGFLIVNRIKKNDSFKDIPLVVISSKSDEDKFEKHRETTTPANMYIHLPISNSELVTRVFTLLEDPLDIDLDLADDILGGDFDDDLDLGLDDDILGDSLDDDLDLGLDDDLDDDLDLDLDLDLDDDLDLGLGNDSLDLDLGVSDDSKDINFDIKPNNNLEADSLITHSENTQDRLEPISNNESIQNIGSTEVISSEKLDKLELEVMERDIKIEELTKQINDLTLQANKPVEVFDTSEFKNKINNLETDLKNKNNKVSDLNKLLLEASSADSNSGSSSNREVLKLKQELTQKGRDIIEYKELYNSKEREVLDLKDGTNNLELKIADQDDLISGYRKKISITEDELNRFKSDYSILTEEKTQLLNEKAGLQDNISDKEILVTSLNEKIASNETKISVLNSSVEEKNKEINEILLPNKRVLEADLDKSKNDFNDLTIKFENLTNQFNTLDFNYKNAQDKIILLEKRTSDNLEEFKNIELQKSKIKQLLEAATGIIDGVVVNTEN